MTRRRRSRVSVMPWVVIAIMLAVAGAMIAAVLWGTPPSPPLGADGVAAPAPNEAEDFTATERQALEGVLNRKSGAAPNK